MKKKITIIAMLVAGFVQGQTIDWTQSIGGPSYDFASVIRTNNLGEVLKGGTFMNTMDFDPNGGTTNLSSGGNNTNGFVQKVDANGDLVWAGVISTPMYSTVEDIEIDDNNNIYVCGAYSGVTEFGLAGTSVVSTSQTASVGTYNTNGYVAKYSNAGQLDWIYSFADSQLEMSRTMKIALSNDDSKVYCYGDFRGFMDVDPLTGAGIITSGGSSISSAFIIELTSAGGYSESYDLRYAYAGDINVDGNGDIIYCGYSSGTTDFDLNPGFNNSFSPDNNTFAFASKMEPDYDPLWVYTINGVGTTYGMTEIATDDNNNCYLSGTFSDVFDFDNTANLAIVSAVQGGTPYLLKLNSAGDYQWVNNDLLSNDLAIDNNGDLIQCGGFQGTVDFDPSSVVSDDVTSSANGDGDAYIRKLNGNGELVWYDIHEIVNGLGGGAQLPFTTMISIDSKGNSLYVNGLYNTDVYVDNVHHSSNGELDSYTIKYSTPCVASNNVTSTGLTLTTDAPTGLQYQWIDCDNNSNISGETGISFTATSNGNYAVVVNTGTCMDTSNCIAVTTVGLNELIQEVGIYPNPTNGNFEIQSNKGIQLVTVTNSLGQMVMESQSDEQYDLSPFENGVYFVSILTSDGWSTKKLIKK